jgi:hypothetical protein
MDYSKGNEVYCNCFYNFITLFVLVESDITLMRLNPIESQSQPSSYFVDHYVNKYITNKKNI